MLTYRVYALIQNKILVNLIQQEVKRPSRVHPKNVIII